MKFSIANVKALRTIGYVVIALIATSCGPAKDVVYMQDLPTNAILTLQEGGELKLQPGDKVDIIVHSRDEELAKMFNLSRPVSTGNTTSRPTYYTVDKNGKIDMPILGPITVEGLTRMEVAQQVKYRLLSGNLLRDPSVIVDFPDMAYYIIGESGVGRHVFPTDKVNLLEALSMSGDLSISGKRTNILVLRTENGKQVPYRVDLTSTDDVYSSPAYYIQQNDMIYVEPTQVKANQSTANGNSYLTPSFWMSMFSFATTLVILFTK
ncbi:MAG: polysaccharide export protein [Muribaculaceae bacterium]|nr:polysaccharide export protein [Muribaculaceae bacterium]